MNASTPLIRNLEPFSLELVRLIRALGIYPVQHPSVRSSAEKVVALAPLDSTGTLTIGVTPIELVVAGQFIGGKSARLANLLYARKILRISLDERCPARGCSGICSTSLHPQNWRG